MMIKNYYQGNENELYHLSVGAVLINALGQIACHHIKKRNNLQDVYLLMRETVEPHEALEDALKRGLMEEFGAKGKLISYIGSLESSYQKGSKIIPKTTLYFIFKLIEIKPTWRKADDWESDSEIEWRDAKFLIPKMQKQAKKYNMTDIDESEILSRINKNNV